MRALLPSPEDNVDVHGWYAENWLGSGGLRVNFVTSVDGAATADGASRGLQTEGDNLVFAALRDLSDVVVAGAGTVRIEGYEPISVSPDRQRVRAQYGLPITLPTAVISRSLRLDPDSPLFCEAPSHMRTIVITGTAGDPDVRRALEKVADVVVAGDEDVDFAGAREALEQRGLRRILCEGGPTLFGDLARGGVVDELCLSITPMLTGPGAQRILAGEMWSGGPIKLELAGLLEEDSALFCRYRTTN